MKNVKYFIASIFTQFCFFTSAMQLPIDSSSQDSFKGGNESKSVVLATSNLLSPAENTNGSNATSINKIKKINEFDIQIANEDFEEISFEYNPAPRQRYGNANQDIGAYFNAGDFNNNPLDHANIRSNFFVEYNLAPTPRYGNANQDIGAHFNAGDLNNNPLDNANAHIGMILPPTDLCFLLNENKNTPIWQGRDALTHIVDYKENRKYWDSLKFINSATNVAVRILNIGIIAFPVLGLAFPDKISQKVKNTVTVSMSIGRMVFSVLKINSEAAIKERDKKILSKIIRYQQKKARYDSD